MAALHQVVTLAQNVPSRDIKGDDGRATLHKPQNPLGNAVIFLARQASPDGEVKTVQPPQTIAGPSGRGSSLAVVVVKFDNRSR
jgi:hypothetical protein